MTGPSRPERAIMGHARVNAGRDRRCWLDAMEAELDYLPARRIDWALGSLVAATKDRAAREWRFGIAMIALSGAALFAAVLSGVPLHMLADLTGVSDFRWTPLMALAPLPFAYLLGRIRPFWPPLWLGTAAFLVYQIGPVIVWCATIGSGMQFLWGPNMYSLGIPHPFQVPVVLLVWLAGTWWGAKAGRNRAHAT